MSIIKFLFSLLLIAAVSACGGNDGTTSTNTLTNVNTVVKNTNISGVVFAGSVFTSAGNTISVYDYSKGVKGNLLVSGDIANDGTYQLSIPNIPNAIFIEAVGCYEEKAIKWLATDNGQPYLASSNGVGPLICPAISLSAAVTVTTGTVPLIVAVTPYTHAATGLADYEIRNGSAVVNAVNDSNAKLSQFVGVDIVRTLPVEPNGNTVFGNASLYGALITGIPSWIYNIATPGAGTFGSGSLNSIAFADAMKIDLAQDGVLNGIGRDNNQSVVNVSIGNTALTTSIYRNQIALYSVFRVRGETEGYFNPTTATFATEAQKQAIIGFLPSFVAFNGYTGPLVDSSPVVALNAGQPSLSYAGVPSVSYFNLIPGNTYSGSLPLRGYIHANVGVYGNYTGKNAQGYIDGHSSNVMIYVDGAYYRAISPAAYAGDAIYTTYAWIDTSQFTNGPHTITVYVIDNLGSQASASIAVNFLN